MGTRGLTAIRSNKKLITGRYNGMDSYYDCLGKEVIDFYFYGRGEDILELSETQEEDKDFLKDGLFCEYSYIYNQDNDTLEIYRGFFKKKQAFGIKEEIVNELEKRKEDEYYCHLIMIVDRKKHTKKQVLKAFDIYSNIRNGEGEDEDNGNHYPERKIIPLNLPKNYVQIV